MIEIEILEGQKDVSLLEGTTLKKKKKKKKFKDKTVFRYPPYLTQQFVL